MKKRGLLLYIPCLIGIYCFSLFTASVAFSGPPFPVPPIPGLPHPKKPRPPKPRPPMPVPGPRVHRPPVPVPAPRVYVPGPRIQGPPHGVVVPGPPPPPRRVVRRHLPADVISLHVAGALFFYHLGHYYQQTHEGYVSVTAPIGATIGILPSGCSSFRINGRRYFNCADVYYEPYNDGFLVVESPVPVHRDRGKIVRPGDKVRITANTLNVRSGPGKRFRIVSKVYGGQIVKVDSVDRDWYYVIMPDGSYGWVMSKYTKLKKHYKKNNKHNSKG